MHPTPEVTRGLSFYQNIYRALKSTPSSYFLTYKTEVMNLRHYLYITFISLISLILIPSCHRQLNPQLQQADSLLSVYDTTAAAQLLNQYLAQRHSYNRKDSMYYALLHYDLQNKQFRHFTLGVDSLFMPIYNYYENHGTRYNRMRANYLMGCIYRDLNWPTEAQRYLHMAIAMAGQGQTGFKENSLLSCIYGQLGEIYRYRTDLNASSAMYEKALSHAIQANNEDLIISGQMKLASCLMAKGKYKESIKNYHECLKHANNKSNQYEYNDCILQIAGNYVELENMDSTQKYLSLYEKRMNIQPPQYYTEDKLNNYTYYTEKGNYFFDINQIDSAITLFYRLSHSNNSDYHESAYRMLAGCYDQLGIKDSVIKYLALHSKALIDDQDDILKNQLQELQSNFDVNSERFKANAAQTSKQKMFIYLLLTISFSLLVCIIIFYVYTLKKRKFIRILHLYETAVHDMNCHKQLYEKIQENGTGPDIAIVSKKIQEAKERINSVESEFSDVDLVKVRLEQFQKISVVHSFYQCATQDQKVSKDQWKELSESINDIAPTIMDFLHEHKYQMIEEDYKMCLLVVVGIAPKYIKNILFCSSQKISMQRKRLLKSLFNEEGTPSTFDYKLRSLK